MEFSGNQLVRTRNFYTQNGNFGVAVDFSVTDAQARYEFGVSGSSNVSVILESGQLKYNDLFIQSYLPNRDYSLLMEITDGNVNLIKDDVELAYGLEKQTGNYNYFYFNRAETGANAEFDFYLSGQNLPNYRVDKIGYLFSTGNGSVTGAFSNTSGYEIKVFNSIANGLQALTYISPITGINSGESFNFIYDGDYSSFDLSQPIFTSFYTNFGNVFINFKIIDVSTLNKFISFEPIFDYSFSPDDKINRELFYNNYSGNILTNSFPTDLFFKLEYVDGSGQFTVDDFAQSASFTGFAYGNFLESGIVTGVANIQTGDSSLTGIYSVPFARFQWATGQVTGYFSGFGTGIASGENYTGLAYGPITGSAIGLIRNGSGTFIFDNVLASGSLVGSGAAIGYTGYVNATGFINVSGVPLNSALFIGIDSQPIVKGLHYYTETGLVYYLSGNPQHKVNSCLESGLIFLNSLFSGTQGNGTFIRNYDCAPGLITYSEFLTGGENIGETGFSVYSIGQPFSGRISTAATGSGDYRQFVSGDEPGTFSFTRTFTGTWQFYTGLTQSSLTAVPRINDSLYSGYASLSANSSIVFQVDHQENEFNEEFVNLNISGDFVLNGINQTITQ